MVTEGASFTNIDRIGAEIERHAHEVAEEHGLAATSLVRLLLEIVDLEDRHRVKAIPGVRQRMKSMIQNLTGAQFSPGDT